MSAAERAKARAEAAAEKLAAEKAAEVAAALATARPATFKPAFRPAPSVPAPVPGRLSPAARRRSFLIASSAGRVLAAAGVHLDLTAANDPKLEGAAANTLIMLQEDKRRLKQLQSQERKIELKRELLPNYRDWCNGILASGRGDRGPLDSIFTTILMWTIDVGDYMTALPMAEHVLRYGLEMPAHVKRTPAVFIVEQIAEAAIASYDLADDAAEPFPHAVLPMVEDLIAAVDADMPDEVTAKLQKAIGRAILAGADLEDEDDVRVRQAQTLKHYLRAIQLDPRSGVKGDVTRLKKALGKAEDGDSESDDAAAAAVAALGDAISAADQQNPPASEEEG
ncbi:hypothetical protein GCM10017620_25990 [Brevundimonas intermedia]|uniref:Terminase n=1 Tax=Brevundimonas intermedia TaxID=74315 RepID=A0ABQ5TAI9_9CAUL|nr:phage terminase small subunit [Brevundimonas intermedia]GLK49626.1 hypothetical protein GCM10017620_25990 [Brevundimonas intermedia]